MKKCITKIYDHHHGYGYLRITMQLREDGEVINHKTIEKLMQELDLKARVSAELDITHTRVILVVLHLIY